MHFLVLFFGLISFISIILTTGNQTSFIILRGCETKVQTTRLTVKSIPDCSKVCARDSNCAGFNFDKRTGWCDTFDGTIQREGYMTLSDTITTVYKHNRSKYGVKVFEIYAGSNQSSVDLWYGRGSWSSPSYRNPLIGCWERLGVQKVHFFIHYDTGETRDRISFDGSNSSSTSWFSSNRITDTSLIKRSTPTQYFIIQGHAWRHFFINKHYGGCNVDTGWVVIVDDHPITRGCSWGNSTSYPLILTSAKTKPVRWSSNETRVATKARIVVLASLLGN